MTRKPDISTELAWTDSIHDVPPSGLAKAREASPEELDAIARTLDLVACKRLTVNYSIKPTLDDRYHLSGTLLADVAQSCVVTLDPVDAAIAERFDASFWPEHRMPPPRGGEVDIDDEPDPEPIANGQIAVGRVVFECLAAAIDPFPRKPDAILDRSESATTAPRSSADSPFAVLANIKPKA